MAHDALRTILPIAGWPEDRARTVEITGGSDPVLPTPFRIGAAGAAALAATGLAAADLCEVRTGRRQQVAVDLRQAVASLRSGHYLQVNGAKVRSERNPVMGMYPAKNGRWSYLHANFPNHRAAALRVPGCEENREAVRRAGPRHRRVGGRFGSHPNHSCLPSRRPTGPSKRLSITARPGGRKHDAGCSQNVDTRLQPVSHDLLAGYTHAQVPRYSALARPLAAVAPQPRSPATLPCFSG